MERSFVDLTLLAGLDSVQYTVQGQRTDSSGPMREVFTVNFGRLVSAATLRPGGTMTATVRGGGGMNASDAALVDAIVNSKANTNGTRKAVSR